jgi:hypothetical protein
MENLLGAKSLDKAIEVQTESARAAYDNYVSERNRHAQSGARLWSLRLRVRTGKAQTEGHGSRRIQ